jgi:hypothetical protein
MNTSKPRRGGVKLRGIVGVALLLAVGLTAGMAFGQGAGDEETRAKYRQAASLMGEKKLDEARKLFFELWSKTKTYDVAASLGQIELVAKRYPEAATYLAYAVSNFPPNQPERNLTGLRKWLDESKQYTGALNLTVNVTGASVSVDGTDVGKTPLTSPLYLSSGKHLIMVASDGYKTADKSVESVVGRTDKLELTLEANKNGSGASAANSNGIVVNPFDDSSKDRVASSKPNPWILVGGGVVTVGGLVTGIAFNVKANNEYDKAQRISERLVFDDCYNSSTSLCEKLKEHRENHDSARNISTAAFVVGGAALVGTAVYWLWPRSKPKTATLRVDGMATKNSSWLGVSGNF